MDSRLASQPTLEQQLWLTVIGGSPTETVTDRDNFREFGGTSLQVLHMLLEERLGVTVDIVELLYLLATRNSGGWADQIPGSADGPTV